MKTSPDSLRPVRARAVRSAGGPRPRARRAIKASAAPAPPAAHGGFRKSGGFFGVLLEFAELMGSDFPSSSPGIGAPVPRGRA